MLFLGFFSWFFRIFVVWSAHSCFLNVCDLSHFWKGCLAAEPMGWLRLVGSIKLQVSFAEYCLFYRSLLRKRPMILSILLNVAFPYIAGRTWMPFFLGLFFELLGTFFGFITTLLFSKCAWFQSFLETISLGSANTLWRQRMTFFFPV